MIVEMQMIVYSVNVWLYRYKGRDSQNKAPSTYTAISLPRCKAVIRNGGRVATNVDWLWSWRRIAVITEGNSSISFFGFVFVSVLV